MKYIIWMIAALLLWTPCMAATSSHVTKSKTQHHYTQSHKKTRHQTTQKLAHYKKHTTHKKIAKKKKINSHINKHESSSELTASLGGPIRSIVTTSSSSAPSFVSSIEHRLVEFVRKTVDSAKYTAYKLGGRHFDTTRGVYVLDCSDYVDNVLAAVNPKAYWSLADSAGSEKPTSQHYYEFFSELGQYPSYYWDKVNDVEGLEPGDILVFRKKNSFSRHRASGHVMVVMSKPVLSDDAYLVRVADSAPSGHSEDTRQLHTSGIGIGALLLKVNPDTGKPTAYAWKVGSRWTSVNIAMARPLSQA